MIRGKPVSLLGSEMIFEIATLLQETLDQAVQTNAQNIPTLDEERFNQQRAISQKVQQLEQERHREKSKADVEEEDYLTEMVSQYRKREEKRQKKQDAKFKQDEKDRKSKARFSTRGFCVYFSIFFLVFIMQIWHHFVPFQLSIFIQFSYIYHIP